MIGWPTDRLTSWLGSGKFGLVSGTNTHSFNHRNRGEPNACFQKAISKSRDRPDKLQPGNQRSVKILANPTALTVAKIGVGGGTRVRHTIIVRTLMEVPWQQAFTKVQLRGVRARVQEAHPI